MCGLARHSVSSSEQSQPEHPFTLMTSIRWLLKSIIENRRLSYPNRTPSTRNYRVYNRKPFPKLDVMAPPRPPALDHGTIRFNLSGAADL